MIKVRELQESELEFAKSLTDDEEWGNYLFFRSNPKGTHYERWTHDHGCRRWFNVMRDTVSDKIIKTYKMGESKPDIENE